MDYFLQILKFSSQLSFFLIVLLDNMFCKLSLWIISLQILRLSFQLSFFANCPSGHFFANCHLFENMSSCPYLELKLRCFHSSGSVRLFGRNSEGNCLSKIRSHSVEVHQRKSGIPTVLTTITMFIITFMIIVIIWMIIINFIPLSPPRLSNLDRHE